MAATIVVPQRSPHCPPRAPSLIRDDRDAVLLWNNYWRQGVATLWSESDYGPVARLAALQAGFARLNNPDTMSRANVQIGKLEAALFLTPLSRKQNGIIVEVEPTDLAERRSRKSTLASRLVQAD